MSVASPSTGKLPLPPARAPVLPGILPPVSAEPYVRPCLRPPDNRNAAAAGTKGRYFFQREPFRVRRKDFWPLNYSRKVLED
eukprot:1179065-Prorocentrum_minimum.AAC.1